MHEKDANKVHEKDAKLTTHVNFLSHYDRQRQQLHVVVFVQQRLFFCVESNRGFFCFNKSWDRTSTTTVSWRRVSNINNIYHAARAVRESTCSIDSLALPLFLFRLSGNPPFHSDPLSDDDGNVNAPLRKPRPGL